MPIRNEVSFIESSLKSVLSQDYPQDRMEILVVDGMSTDGTRHLVENVIKCQYRNNVERQADTHSTSLMLLDNPERIVPTALNIGLKHAKGEIIVRVDGHCEIAPNYVRQCVEFIQRKNADCVGGLQRAKSMGLIGNAIALATSSPFGVGNALFHYSKDSGWVDTVYLGAYKRQVFAKIGLFDEELIRNQDDEFNFRLRQSNGRIWLDHSIRSIYYTRANFSSLCRQYFQYGMFKIRVIQKREAVPSLRHLIPGAFVFSIVLTSLLALITRQTIWIFTVLGPYMLVTISASIWTARKHPNIMPILPLVFFCLHVSYGIGFFAGIWKWRRQFFDLHLIKKVLKIHIPKGGSGMI